MVIHSLLHQIGATTPRQTGQSVKKYDRLVENCHDTMKKSSSGLKIAGVTLDDREYRRHRPIFRCALAETVSTALLMAVVDSIRARAYAARTNGAAPVELLRAPCRPIVCSISICKMLTATADRHWAIGRGRSVGKALFRAWENSKNTPA